MTLAGTMSDLTYDWDDSGPSESFRGFVDETIRDGLQGPYVPSLSDDDKIELLSLMEATRLSDVVVGMVGLGPENRLSLENILRAHTKHAYGIQPWLLSRARPECLRELLELRDRTRSPVGMNVFVSVSRIRLAVEEWHLDEVLGRLRETLAFGRTHFSQIRVALEDGTRTEPEILDRAIGVAVEGGATRLALADTAGQATPEGVRRLFAFALERHPSLNGPGPALEWHGHNDRGLAVANSLESIRAGARYVHGTIMGIGERNGNAALDTMLFNCSATLPDFADWESLVLYVERVGTMVRASLPDHYPYIGRASFTSGTGTHCAAMAKAFSLGRPDLARRLFSPDSYPNRRADPTLLLSRLSGRRVAAWLLERAGANATQGAVDALVAWARRQPDSLTIEQLRAHVGGPWPFAPRGTPLQGLDEDTERGARS